MCGTINMTDKIKNILLYTGVIGALISAIAYVVLTIVIVMGFETEMDSNKQLLFSIIGALDGLLITNLLRSQGVSLAKQEPQNKAVMDEYNKLINKNKKVKSLKQIHYYFVKNFIMDIFSKAATIGATSYFMLYIFMDGSGDVSLILLAFANIFMFMGFGLIALSKFYDLYNNEHIQAVKELIERLKDQVRSVALEREQNANIQQHEVLVITSASQQEQERHPSITRESSGHIELNS